MNVVPHVCMIFINGSFILNWQRSVLIPVNPFDFARYYVYSVTHRIAWATYVCVCQTEHMFI